MRSEFIAGAVTLAAAADVLVGSAIAHPGTVISYHQRDPAKRTLIIDLLKPRTGEV